MITTKAQSFEGRGALARAANAIDLFTAQGWRVVSVATVLAQNFEADQVLLVMEYDNAPAAPEATHATPAVARLVEAVRAYIASDGTGPAFTAMCKAMEPFEKEPK